MARKIVLKHLANRYGRTFANHWESATRRNSGLISTSPRRRNGRRGRKLVQRLPAALHPVGLVHSYPGGLRCGKGDGHD
jgi:hypothetical protein